MRTAPLPSSRRTWRFWLSLGILVGAALVFRVAVVRSWHAPGGTGTQYYELAQELRATGRLASAPPPAPPTWGRLPGYPLFLAYAVARAPLPLADHLRAATLWNAAFDVLTALLVLLLARRFRLGRGTALLAFALVITSPILLFLSTYALPESLSTLLTTLELYLALRATRARPLPWAAGAGAAWGLAQLVRTDAVALVPAVLLCLYLSRAPGPRRLLAALAFFAAAAVVFSPWVVRNERLFHASHWAGPEWVSLKTHPLPIGPARWMLTWASGAPGETYITLLFELEQPLDPSRHSVLLPVMYDSPAERERIAALLRQYNREGLSEAVSQGFYQLAVERARSHPLRTFVVLPLHRLVSLFTPMPEYELPVRTPLLGLPQHRDLYGGWDLACYGLALIGAARLLLRGGRRRELAAVLLLAIGTRAGMLALVHPLPTQRYLAETMPALLLLSAAALTWGPALLLRKFRTSARAPAPP